MSAAQKTIGNDEIDQAQDDFTAALAWHDGDAEATIRTLLANCKHLRQQLVLAEISLSLGFTRGWRPCREPAAAAVEGAIVSG
ncbi:hypothetical protein LPJGGPFB_04864 [Ensifer adhaerens]|uniref:hypothetical protein n=1 Tax=Ensifer adhaerens TaxID=106592 RepID=UPI0015688D5D|nr:hypothetical protein [Ensifer adhaerens]NRP21605.1 hypothetical protein [Ensifer adhaerens]